MQNHGLYQEGNSLFCSSLKITQAFFFPLKSKCLSSWFLIEPLSFLPHQSLSFQNFWFDSCSLSLQFIAHTFQKNIWVQHWCGGGPSDACISRDLTRKRHTITVFASFRDKTQTCSFFPLLVVLLPTWAVNWVLGWEEMDDHRIVIKNTPIRGGFRFFSLDMGYLFSLYITQSKMTFPSTPRHALYAIWWGALASHWLPCFSAAASTCSLSPSIAILLLLHHPSTTNRTNQTTAPLTSKLQRFSWKNLAGIKKTKITYLFNCWSQMEMEGVWLCFLDEMLWFQL